MNKKIKVTSAAAAALASLVLVNANVNNEVRLILRRLMILRLLKKHKHQKRLLGLMLLVRKRMLRLNKAT